MSKFQINLPKTSFSMRANLPSKEPEFLKFIRAEKKFKNVDQLKKQIKVDLTTAKKIK